MTPEKLVELAKEAMTHAYVPYSGYKVGAALLCADGTVYQGCNIENAAYGPTNCAERTAFFKAVYDGHRDFVSIAVCGGKDGIITGAFPPCGVCRQVMREFCEDDFMIYIVNADGKYDAVPMCELLPHSFSYPWITNAASSLAGSISCRDRLLYPTEMRPRRTSTKGL
jgi:cytidine deaminase